MKLLLFILCVCSSFASIAQKTAEISDANATKRTLNASFNAISVSDGIALYLTDGGEESIAVSFSEAKYETRFKTVVDNGTLKISFDNDGINWNDNRKRKLKAYVSYKTLSKLTASGGSDVILTGPVKVNDLDLKFTSGTRLTGKINATSITVVQSSGSEINLSGNAQKINVEASSGASFKGYDFNVDYCSAKASSGGAIRVSVKKELEAKANSGGAIHFKGEGVIRDVNVNSGGVVKKA